MVNLSSRPLSELEMEVLNKGLGFVPTPTYKPFDTRIDVYKLIRQIKLKKLFGASNKITDGPYLGPSKSNFVPNINDPMISAFERLVHWDISALEQRTQTKYSNLTKRGKEALEDLASDKTIIIKEADKGGATVLMDRETYINSIWEQLNNVEFYQEIPDDPGKSISGLIQMVLVEASNLGYILETTAKSLTKSQYRTPTFYTLPKIHKPGNPPPGRPIVSGCDSLLEPLSKFLDYFLQPLLLKTKSYLKDTQDLIDKIEDMILPENTVLLTLDVTALYTNIQHSEAYRVISAALDTRESLNPPTHILLEILELILGKKYFRFMDRYFLQIKGIAMGLAAAPSIANLFMASFETQYIFSELNPFAQNIIFFRRFIDDLLIFYTQAIYEMDQHTGRRHAIYWTI